MPFGILGGRIYHVVTDPELYFAAGRSPIRALYIWEGGIDAANRPADTPTIALHHPTFLYECLWNLAVAALLIWAERRFRLGGGRLFALYVAAYTVGRAWIEALRVDHTNHVLGLRLNDWTSLLVFLGAIVYLRWGADALLAGVRQALRTPTRRR